MRPALFWYIKQRRVVTWYRSFGTSGRYIVPKRRYRITTLRCLILKQRKYHLHRDRLAEIQQFRLEENIYLQGFFIAMYLLT